MNKLEKKIYMRAYMRNYSQDSRYMICEICGAKIKEYRKSIHNKTKKHLSCVNKKNNEDEFIDI